MSVSDVLKNLNFCASKIKLQLTPARSRRGGRAVWVEPVANNPTLELFACNVVCCYVKPSEVQRRVAEKELGSCNISLDQLKPIMKEIHFKLKV